MHLHRLTFAAAGTLLALAAPALSVEAAPSGDKEKAKPLVLFVGDSITNGKPSGQKDYKPPEGAPGHFAAGSYGYVEALWEATRSKDIDFRIDKLGSGGQAITGWIGTCCRQILEKRHRDIKEMPAYLVVQDYITGKTPESLKAIEDALRAMQAQAAKAGNVKLVWSTVVTDPKGASGLKAADENVAATNEVILKVAKELEVPVIRLDTAWARYVEFSKDKAPAKDWILTNHGAYSDGVHPGKVGAFFQALVFARELGVPAEKFDETAAALNVPAGQAAEIEKLVYSWKDPTVIPLPEAKPGAGTGEKVEKPQPPEAAGQ